MAAITSHPSFLQPADTDGVLWRYMDISRLLWFLTKSELYLSQLGTLDDPLEGTYPPAMRSSLIEWMRQHLTAEQVAQLPNGYPVDLHTSLMRASLYVNCWCMQPHESEAMWRIYGGTTGAAIRTKYSKLALSLPDDVYIGQVQYIDPNVNRIPVNDVLGLVMYKRHFYSHEMECRIVKMSVQTKADNPLLVDESFDRYPKGMSLSLAILQAVDDVIVSPLAPPWIYESIRHIADKFVPELPVLHSKMRS